MKNNWQLVSLDLAKKMKELGFKQESLWWWIRIRNGEPELIEYSQFTMLECNSPHAYKRICSAYTVAELGEMLPKIIEDCYIQFGWASLPKDKKWDVCYRNMNRTLYVCLANTEANVRAKMLIYLEEKGII